ncbi:hypothetical protein D6745_00060, partial [Candidatus Woesearchaeota archaeon]
MALSNKLSSKLRLFFAFVLVLGLFTVIAPKAESLGRSEYTPCWEGRTRLSMPYEHTPFWSGRVRVLMPPEYYPRTDPVFLLPRGPEYIPQVDPKFTLEDIQRRRGAVKCYECGYEDEYYRKGYFYDDVYPHRFYIVNTKNDSRVGHGYFVSPSRVLNNRNLIHS